MSRGDLAEKNFTDTIYGEVQNRLLIVPVKLKGKTYRFLFDSGAPLSISHELQEEFSYKRISSGNITDSDQNKLKVEYVALDTILVGDIPFTNQTAFVADFTANPILGCLKLDGILGSNLMRYCNWTIDYESASVILTSELDSLHGEDIYVLPFWADAQYDIHAGLSIGRAELTNLEVDYGSTGGLLVPTGVFETLKTEGIITKTYLTTGQKQSGLIGKPVELKQESAYTDSMTFADVQLNKVHIRSGHKGLIGHGILSRFVVSIDWDQQMLFLKG